MSMESEAGHDLALGHDDAEEVVGGRRKSKSAVTGTGRYPARALPVVITVEPTTPPVPGPPDLGADNSGPDADNC